MDGRVNNSLDLELCRLAYQGVRSENASMCRPGEQLQKTKSNLEDLLAINQIEHQRAALPCISSGESNIVREMFFVKLVVTLALQPVGAGCLCSSGKKSTTIFLKSPTGNIVFIL